MHGTPDDPQTPSPLFDVDFLEYPRPHMARKEWMSLTDKAWHYEFDDLNTGLSDGWQNKRLAGGITKMPRPFQSEEGVNDQSYHPVAWVSTTFDVPPDWMKTEGVDEDMMVHFGAVKTKCTVFINGQEAKTNDSGYVPFSLNVTPYLNKDGSENRITLRIEHRLDPSVPSGKDSLTNKPHWIWYTPASGVLQPIWMEPCPVVQIEDVKITSSARNRTLDLEVPISCAHKVESVEVEAYDQNTGLLVAKATETPTASGARLRLQFPQDAALWSPKNPTLYDIRVALKDASGHTIDAIRSYAGLRDIRLKNGLYHINDEPTFLLGPLCQGYFPGTLLAAPDGQALKQHVEDVLSCGFNTARKHAKIEDPRWYYWASKLGLMVWQDMPCTRTMTAESEGRLKEQFTRAVMRHINEPSIITWTFDNETNCAPKMEEGNKKQRTFLEEAARVVRQIDPSRPVVPEDGWNNLTTTGVVTAHEYAANGEEMGSHYTDIEDGGPFGRFAGTSPFRLMAPNEVYYGQPIVFTEVNGFLWNSVAESGIEYARAHSAEEYLARYESNMQKIADMGFVAGFFHTQDRNVQHEKNGLQDEHGHWLVDPAKIKEINDRVFAPEVLHRNVERVKQILARAAVVERDKAISVRRALRAPQYAPAGP